MKKQEEIKPQIIRDFSKEVIAIIEHTKTPENERLDKSIAFIIEEATRRKIPKKDQLTLMSTLFKTVIAPRLVREMLEHMCSECREEGTRPYIPNKLKDETIGGIYA